MHLLKRSMYHLLKCWKKDTENYLSITLATKKERKLENTFDLDFFFPLPIKLYFREAAIQQDWLHYLQETPKLSLFSSAILIGKVFDNAVIVLTNSPGQSFQQPLACQGLLLRTVAVKFWVLSPTPTLSKWVPCVWNVSAMKPQS